LIGSAGKKAALIHVKQRDAHICVKLRSKHGSAFREDLISGKTIFLALGNGCLKKGKPEQARAFLFG
jgi:hypothetical protein